MNSVSKTVFKCGPKVEQQCCAVGMAVNTNAVLPGTIL